MPEAYGSTQVGYEVANALGELNRSRPRLGARFDANRGGLASYARAARLFLNGVDLYCSANGISIPQGALMHPERLAKVRFTAVRRPDGVTWVLDGA